MKAARRRAALLDAATERFASRGYHATGVSEIIAAAGVARGTFYLYFESKHQIFCEILDGFLAHLDSRIKTIELESRTSPAEQMRSNVEGLVDAILKKPGPAKIVFNEAVGLNPEIDAKLRAFYGKLMQRISASLVKGMRLGLVREVDPTVASCIIVGAFRELMVQRIVFRKKGLSRDDIVRGLMDTILGGLGGRPIGG